MSHEIEIPTPGQMFAIARKHFLDRNAQGLMSIFAQNPDYTHINLASSTDPEIRATFTKGEALQLIANTDLRLFLQAIDVGLDPTEIDLAVHNLLYPPIILAEEEPWQ